MPDYLLIVLASLSGVLQFTGYVLYIRGFLNGRIKPNVPTWIMFAYGTALLTVIEYDRNATWLELLLPTVCAICGLYVAWRCWRLLKQRDPEAWWPRDWWPEDRADRYAFIGDVTITVLYAGAFLLMSRGILSSGGREAAATLFLVGSNLTTFTAFIPIIRSTRRRPEMEDAIPWVVWTAAYAMLFLITYLTHGLMTVLIIYPLSCVILHGLIAYLARDPSTKRRASMHQSSQQ